MVKYLFTVVVGSTRSTKLRLRFNGSINVSRETYPLKRWAFKARILFPKKQIHIHKKFFLFMYFII